MQWTVKNDEIQVTSLEVFLDFGLTAASRRNLEQFIKSQKKIESFRGIFPNLLYDAFFSSMLKHVQTLDTLRSISIHDIGAVQEVFPETVNYHVESLTLRQMSMCYEVTEKKYIELFPNLKKLVMYPDTWISNLVIEQINSMVSLEEFKIVDTGERGYHELINLATRAESANSKSRISRNSSCIHAMDVEVNEMISSRKSPKSNRIQIES